MSEPDPFLPPSERARRAVSFATVATEYERGRPSYPQQAIRWLLGSAPLEVLDLGAGTGKLSSAVLEAGHRVRAVEPLEEMRSVLARAVPGARVLDGTAEHLPLADASVDAVVVGAAFHWFEQHAALGEIARVLREPGVLGLLGNGFDTSRPWVASLRSILGPPALERPGHWPSPAVLGELFANVGDRSFPHTQRVDPLRLRDLALSRSSVAAEPPAEREVVLGEIDALWEQEPELAGRGDATLPWITRVRRCRTLR
jgi:SAM-dependent methyltransferase